jgi:hypothetical protein
MDTTTTAGMGLARGVEVTNRLTLSSNENDLLHLVCCREPEWKAAFCGYETDVIDLTGNTVCTMCIEVARQRDSQFGTREIATCPIDLRPCPDEHEIDLRILREVDPR